MLKFISFFLLFLVIASCDLSENKATSTINSDKSTQIIDTLKNNNQKTIDTIRLLKIDLKDLPKGIKYSGKIIQSQRWIDKEGDNIIITTETGGYINPSVKHENEGADADLYAYHFVISDNEAKSSWTVHDYIHDCPVDYEAKFIKNTLQITDLNKNGIGEIWLMYKTACHGDVSPSDMKIIMYEGKLVHKMIGTNKVEIGPGEFYGGEYKFDKSFQEGPKEFINFAKNLWRKNIMQTW